MPTSSTARATPLSTTKRRAPVAPVTGAPGTIRKKRAGVSGTTATSTGNRPLQSSTASNKATSVDSQTAPPHEEGKRRKLGEDSAEQENCGGNTGAERPASKEDGAQKPKIVLSDSEKNMTVEQYLTSQAETLRQAVLDTAEEQVQKLKENFADEKSLMQEAIQTRINQEHVAEKQGRERVCKIHDQGCNTCYFLYVLQAPKSKSE
eukprot:gb/GECG01000567.1/.p1 GENE.gb/GECG01000567.1/~~gb/GECG01000567.1/.p1  ORF type:complete len:206 (+),score=33.46 gb/GECG01000567.1/:1-618(+)